MNVLISATIWWENKTRVWFWEKNNFRSRNRNNTKVSLLIFFKCAKKKNKLP
jgi:hypothetical protein